MYVTYKPLGTTGIRHQCHTNLGNNSKVGLREDAAKYGY